MASFLAAFDCLSLRSTRAAMAEQVGVGHDRRSEDASYARCGLAPQRALRPSAQRRPRRNDPRRAEPGRSPAQRRHARAGPGAHDGDPPVPIDLTPAFLDGLYFFGRTYRAIFVNINGIVSFDQPIPTGTPRVLPFTGQPMLAPWWADVDTRGGGQPARNNVCFVLQPGRLVVTWDRVGGHDRQDDRLNSFQLVVRTRYDCGIDLPVIEFRYARCEWTLGDASGDAHALIGFDMGSRVNFLWLPRSLTPAVADLCRLTNLREGPPGLYRFQFALTGCFGNI